MANTSKPISFYPLTFDQAVAGILAAKPEPKEPKPKKQKGAK
jgi:hypothetical protein